MSTQSNEVLNINVECAAGVKILTEGEEIWMTGKYHIQALDEWEVLADGWMD